MSQEILEIMRGMDIRSIETQLALQCAPLITGLKISNLLIIPATERSLVKVILERSGISFFRLLATSEKIVYLLFKREKLESYLMKRDVQEMLHGEGYEDLRMGMVLRRFQIRYEEYMSDGDSFPHEMGLLLGYPTEDVKGFIENEGKNFLYNGYWKVYGNMNEKVELFKRYDTAKETIIQLLSKGVGIVHIIKLYNANELHHAAV